MATTKKVTTKKVTTKSKTLKVIDSTEFIKISGVTKLQKIYKINDKTFRISYENSNGSPMGFNHKMCLSQYDGIKWNNLEDISALAGKIDKIPSYYSTDSHKHCLTFFDLMEDRIKNIYA